MSDTLLFEIGTEELPSKSLLPLSSALKNNVEDSLKKAGLNFTDIKAFATPRRIALMVKDLEAKQPTQNIERKGPALQAAFDNDGNPTKACEGFAKSCGCSVKELEKVETDKGTWLMHRSEQAGKTLNELLPDILQQAIKQLPIAKRMRWGNGNAEFVRPVHWILLMHGKTVIDTEILGLSSSNITYGHRFHAPDAIKLKKADDYEDTLFKAHVIADFDMRKQHIQTLSQRAVKKVQGQIIIEPALLEEVTGIVEWPAPLLVPFDARFLQVPKEALIAVMRDHQKCFYIEDTQGELLPYFITVSNLEIKDPSLIIQGNQKVMTARFSDAEFFYNIDQKHSLESRIDGLKHVIFQAKLGTLHDKAQRISALAKTVAQEIKGDAQSAERAGLLAKTDLMTDMVGEFPELQGIMGRYYALNDNENETIAHAIGQHYQPRFSGDALPETKEALSVAIADRMDTLVGIFGINQAPTGDKDPFALRRAALGILRMMLEKQLDLDLKRLLQQAKEAYDITLENQNVLQDCYDFIIERLKAWYLERNVKADVFAAVVAKQPARPLDFHQRMEAVIAFREIPAAKSLAAANKRVSNILSKQGTVKLPDKLQDNLLQETAEINLAKAIAQQSQQVMPLLQAGKYNEALTQLAELREPVDQFFDDVMVMVDDEALRNNRLVLLKQLRGLFLEAADISLLQD